MVGQAPAVARLDVAGPPVGQVAAPPHHDLSREKRGGLSVFMPALCRVRAKGGN